MHCIGNRSLLIGHHRHQLNIFHRRTKDDSLHSSSAEIDAHARVPAATDIHGSQCTPLPQHPSRQNINAQ
jgi:hypothetical protein